MPHQVTVACFETMGVPNSEARCLDCGEGASYFPKRAKDEGFSSDLAAAEAWAKKHREENASNAT